jgi:hypothetical protein
MLKTFILTISMILVASCNSSKTPTANTDTTSKTIVLTDSSRKELVNALDDIIKSNAKPDDVTISAKFVKQGNYDNGDSYITIKTKDSTLTLINPMPLKEEEITKLKRDGNNVTLTYSSSDKTVKFLAADYQTEN